MPKPTTPSPLATEASTSGDGVTRVHFADKHMLALRTDHATSPTKVIRVELWQRTKQLIAVDCTNGIKVLKEARDLSDLVRHWQSAIDFLGQTPTAVAWKTMEISTSYLKAVRQLIRNPGPH